VFYVRIGELPDGSIVERLVNYGVNHFLYGSQPQEGLRVCYFNAAQSKQKNYSYWSDGASNT